MAPLEDLLFSNQSLSALPLDPIKDRESRPVKGAWFSKLEPQLDPLENPFLVSFSSDALNLLDLDMAQVSWGGEHHGGENGQVLTLLDLG